MNLDELSENSSGYQFPGIQRSVRECHLQETEVSDKDSLQAQQAEILRLFKLFCR